MFQVGDYVVYKRDICKIIDLKKMNGEDYYVLVPKDDDTLFISLPVSKKDSFRMLMTEEEIKKLIEKIPSIPIVDSNNRMLESEYKSLLASGRQEDLIRIIKTTYLRNQDRLDHKKRVAEKDLYYFNKAESYLYGEIGLVLGMELEETKKYLCSQIEKSQ